MKLASLGVAALLAACVTAKPTYLPDGRQGLSISCSGSALSWADCETKAGDTCKERGYDVVSATQDGQQIAVGSANASYASATSVTKINRTLLIACK